MRASVVLLASFVSLFAVDVALARDWLVERVSGTAWAIDAKGRTRIEPQMTIPEGRTIQTAAGGRVRLTSENNVMTLAPNSVVSVVPKGFFSSKTQVLERYGSVEFDIEKRDRPHFSVDTPFMAAVVKGTKFTIDVSKIDTKIGVARGLVQVSDLRSGETAGIGIGQRAAVSQKSRGLKTAGPKAPAVSAGKPSRPSVAPLGQDLKSFSAQMAAASVAAKKAAAAGRVSEQYGYSATTTAASPSETNDSDATGVGGRSGIGSSTASSGGLGGSGSNGHTGDSHRADIGSVGYAGSRATERGETGSDGGGSARPGRGSSDPGDNKDKGGKNDGDKGTKGSDGDKGGKGDSGSKNDKGGKGGKNDGDKGGKGSDGDKGDDGKGDKNDKGDKGGKGSDGDKSGKGDRGKGDKGGDGDKGGKNDKGKK